MPTSSSQDNILPTILPIDSEPYQLALFLRRQYEHKKAVLEPMLAKAHTLRHTLENPFERLYPHIDKTNVEARELIRKLTDCVHHTNAAFMAMTKSCEEAQRQLDRFMLLYERATMALNALGSDQGKRLTLARPRITAAKSAEVGDDTLGDLAEELRPSMEEEDLSFLLAKARNLVQRSEVAEAAALQRDYGRYTAGPSSSRTKTHKDAHTSSGSRTASGKAGVDIDAGRSDRATNTLNSKLKKRNTTEARHDRVQEQAEQVAALLGRIFLKEKDTARDKAEAKASPRRSNTHAQWIHAFRTESSVGQADGAPLSTSPSLESDSFQTAIIGPGPGSGLEPAAPHPSAVRFDTPEGPHQYEHQHPHAHAHRPHRVPTSSDDDKDSPKASTPHPKTRIKVYSDEGAGAPFTSKDRPAAAREGHEAGSMTLRPGPSGGSAGAPMTATTTMRRPLAPLNGIRTAKYAPERAEEPVGADAPSVGGKGLKLARVQRLLVENSAPASLLR